MQPLGHLAAQRLRGDDLHVRPMAQDVHDELTRVGVGNAQFVAAVGKVLALLRGVPALLGHPAGALRREAKHGGGRGCTSEDTIDLGEVGI